MRPGVVAVVVGLMVIVGCGPAAPAPAPVASSAAQPAAGAAAGQATPAGDAAYRQQVIDAARSEGEVNVALQSAWTPEGIRALEDAVQREYGVPIKINFTPVQNYIQRVAELSSELAAGATPSFDVHQTSDANAVLMLDRDLLEPVNWAALLPTGTPPEIVKGDSRLAVVLTDHSGLMYDPTVIPEAEVPRSLKDLGNPKWRGKVMLMQYPSAYFPWVITLGREPMLQALRAAMQNGAVPDTYANEYTRFTAKEFPMVTTVGSYTVTAQKRGAAAAFAPLDVSAGGDHFVAVPRKAAHANAAKLVAAVLVGPEGQRIAEEYVGYSNRYYKGSADNRLEQAARAAGFPSLIWWDSPEARALTTSPEGQEIQEEVQQIFQGG
ncbi:MAG TPA: extracellular solute-binding protein [Chloroflexota bacterium]|nr:extracellular solute-binding protein [Chloroflexota bacterium]